MKKTLFKRLLFLVLFIGVVLFFLWSKLVIISLLLILVADTFTTQIIPKYLKNKLPKDVFNTLKYAYYLLLPISLAILIRAFFIDIYFVPSSSMEDTLFPDDYVIVNKVSYGTKVPKRLQDVPVIGGLFKKGGEMTDYNIYRSLKGPKPFKREDIVVFKSPNESDVFLIKRIIGMPSDTVKIIDSKVMINNIHLKDKELYCYNYIDSTKVGILKFKTYSNREFDKFDEEYKNRLKKNTKNSEEKWYVLFPDPYAKEKNWSKDDYGEIVVPKKGMKISLNEVNFSIYKSILKNFENQKFEISKGESKAYTFTNDYYFMMGDNRHGSIDSRMFGFIPEVYIQGKMVNTFSRKRFLD